jgi:hypothetical protein
VRAGIMRDAAGGVSLRFIQMTFNATFPLALPNSQVLLQCVARPTECCDLPTRIMPTA